MSVLVLNASFEPLSVVSTRRAVVLILKRRADLVEGDEAQLRSEHLSVQRPVVIRLLHYVRVPYRAHAPLSRRGVLARDRWTCQYCGARPGKGVMTVDHVVPRVQGGGRSWDNLVAACQRCNHRKGGRRPDQARMTLRRRPRVPRFLPVARLDPSVADERESRWRKYIPG